MLPPLTNAYARVILHTDNATTDCGNAIYESAVKAYISPQRFGEEMKEVVKRRPLPFVPSSRLAGSGSFISGELSGVPLVAVRDKEGRARVFLNVCRHRGAALVTEQTGINVRNFKCPFHGWTYQLEGTLAYVPEEAKCFSHDKLAGLHLVELKSTELASLVWVILNPDAPEPIENFFGEFLTDFAALKFENHEPLREFSYLLKANWKIAVEGFLEGYHFQHAHKKFLADMRFPNLSLTDFSGENARVIVPLLEPSKETSVVQWSHVLYFIFPSTFLLAYEDHFALIAFIPLTVDKTFFFNIPLVPAGASATTVQGVEQKARLVVEIVKEDFLIEEAIQKGLSSDANKVFTFTRLEHALAEFQKNLARCLADK